MIQLGQDVHIDAGLAAGVIDLSYCDGWAGRVVRIEAGRTLRDLPELPGGWAWIECLNPHGQVVHITCPIPAARSTHIAFS